MKIVLTAAAAAGVLLCVQIARADNCGVLEDAMDKMATSTTRMHIERAGAHQGAAADRMADVIMSGDKMYVQVQGAWHSMPRTDFSQMKAKLEAARASKQVACEQLSDETLGGRAASVYHVTDNSDGGRKTDVKVWLAKNNGLPLRVDSSDRMSITYDYDNIQVPANAQPIGVPQPHSGG